MKFDFFVISVDMIGYSEVCALNAQDDFGRIVISESRDIYRHRVAVKHFKKLRNVHSHATAYEEEIALLRASV